MEDGVIFWDMVTELASLEFLFHLHMTNDIAWNALEVAMKKKGVGLPNTFEPVELCSMSETNKLNSRRNIGIE